MKLEHEIRWRFLTVPGISDEPIVTTDKLLILGGELCIGFIMPSKDGRSFDPSGMTIPVRRVIELIEEAADAVQDS